MRRAVGTTVLVLLFSQFEAGFGCSPKGVSYLTSMRSDLHNLRDAEAEFFRSHGRFTADLAGLPFVTSTSVHVDIERADSARWVARTRHEYLRATCAATGAANEPSEAEPHIDCDTRGDPLLDDPYHVRGAMNVSLASLAVVLVALWFARRARARPRWPFVLLVLMFVFHPVWLVALKAMPVGSDCGTSAMGAALFYALLAPLLVLLQRRQSRHDQQWIPRTS